MKTTPTSQRTPFSPRVVGKIVRMFFDIAFGCELTYCTWWCTAQNIAIVTGLQVVKNVFTKVLIEQ